MSPKVLLRSSVAADFDMMKARAAIAVVCKKLRRSALMLLGTQASCRSAARRVVRNRPQLGQIYSMTTFSDKGHRDRDLLGKNNRLALGEQDKCRTHVTAICVPIWKSTCVQRHRQR